MAYTTTPQQSTNKTERYSFVGNPQQFDGASLKNQRTVNMYPELNYVSITQNKTYFLKKRPGLKLSTQLAAGQGRGIFNWLGIILVAIGNTLYANGSAILTMSTTTGRVGFSAFFGQSYGKALIFVDGTNGWVINPALVVTPITSTYFPTPHIPDPIVIDEYLLLSKAGTGDFYQSSLDDPTTWTPGDFITAEMFPDDTVAMTQFKNYVVVGGASSIEFFYDAGNPDGSSFARSEAVIQQLGVLAPNSLKTTEEQIVFIGESDQGGKSVWMIDKFKSVDICIEPVRQAIDAEGANIVNVSGIVVRTVGHQFYIISLSTRTFVYDMELKIWHEWEFDNGVFDFRFASFDNNNNPLLLHSSNGKVFELDQFTYTDDTSIPIACLVQTDELDMKSYNRKVWNRITIKYDIDDGPDSFMDVYWSDDNFMTLSAGRQINLKAAFPVLYKMGMSRVRAYKFGFTDNRPLRLEFYEIDANIMSS